MLCHDESYLHMGLSMAIENGSAFEFTIAYFTRRNFLRSFLYKKKIQF